MSKKIKQRLPIEKILAPFGLIAILGFPTAGLFFGITDLQITCQRSVIEEQPTCKIQDKRLFGLYNYTATAKKVTGIGYNTNNISTTSRPILASNVVMSTHNGEIPVTKVASNFGEKWKKEIILKVNRYLMEKKELFLVINKKEITFPGWIGIIFWGFIVYSYISFAVSWIIKKSSK